jgi:hypothetical protein
MSGTTVIADAPSASIAFPRWLLWSAGVITLLYFPNALLHAWLGPAIYGRDVLLGLHLALALLWLSRTGRLASFFRQSWVLLLPAIFVLPALVGADSRIEGLAFLKWSAMWMDWLIMGRLLAGRGILFAAFTPLAVAAAGLLVIDFFAGAYELRTNEYLFAQRGQTSAMGVRLNRALKLEKRLRVKGLQRDVFSYANLMAMSMVAGFAVCAAAKEPAWRTGSLVWSGFFGAMLFYSGGRSAFLGVLASAFFLAGLLGARSLARNYQRWIVLGWLGLVLALSFLGVGRLTEWVGSNVMAGSHIGNSRSAYSRDENWSDIMEAIEKVPIVLFSGAPAASLLDTKIAPIFHWADNQYLWLLYHSGLAGFLGVVFFFFRVLQSNTSATRAWASDALILFLLFVIGEGLARESMTFIGCLPLFLATGYCTTSESASERRRSGRPEATAHHKLRREIPVNGEEKTS